MDARKNYGGSLNIKEVHIESSVYLHHAYRESEGSGGRLRRLSCFLPGPLRFAYARRAYCLTIEFQLSIKIHPLRQSKYFLNYFIK